MFFVLSFFFLPKAMLKSVAPFLSTFHRLVSSVMHEGQQKGDKGKILLNFHGQLIVGQNFVN